MELNTKAFMTSLTVLFLALCLAPIVSSSHKSDQWPIYTGPAENEKNIKTRGRPLDSRLARKPLLGKKQNRKNQQKTTDLSRAGNILRGGEDGREINSNNNKGLKKINKSRIKKKKTRGIRTGKSID